MDFAYVAHTEACTFLLDAEGVCRWFIAKEGANEATIKAAERCVGAQYVASLDAQADGLMIHVPKPGTRLLFARVGGGGRITLVRSGPVTSFETVDAPATTPDDVAPQAAAAELPPTVASPATSAAETVRAPQANDEDDCATAPWSGARPTVRARSADDTEPPTTKRAPQTIRAFPAPPNLRPEAAARRGMLPRTPQRSA